MREKRPRPVRVFVAVATGVNMIALSVLPVLSSFEIIDWTGQQVGMVEVAIGTVVTAVTGVVAAIAGNGSLLGTVQRQLHVSPVESRVTPTSDPRDNALVPLVPIANDGYED